MKNILHINSSPRGRAAESDRLSRKIIALLQRREPGAVVKERVVGGGAIPHIDESYATALGSAQTSDAERQPQGSMALSEELIGELENSDIVVIATPMHNYTVPSGLKAWLDHVIRVRRTFEATPAGKVGLLRNRPVLVAVSSGGRFSGDNARQPDFLTPYLRAALGTIGLCDLTFFSVEGTALDADALAKAQARAEHAIQSYFSAPALKANA